MPGRVAHGTGESLRGLVVRDVWGLRAGFLEAQDFSSRRGSQRNPWAVVAFSNC